MQSAYDRAKDQLADVMERSATEIVDRPIDGRRLTLQERQDWFAGARAQPQLLAAKQAELAARFQLRPDRPVSRRLVMRIRQGLRDESAEEKA